MTLGRGTKVGVLVAVLIALPLIAWLAFGYFGVHRLFVDETVDEELTTFVTASPPTTGAGSSPSTGDTSTSVPAPAQPVLVATGELRGIEGHRVAGTANLIQSADGTYLVQFPNLDADNGPDLVVWLSRGGSSEDIVDLGELRGNQGSQEYGVPAGVDATDYDTVIIWCRRFSVGFGQADLS
jgi:hypothetical protein